MYYPGIWKRPTFIWHMLSTCHVKLRKNAIWIVHTAIILLRVLLLSSSCMKWMLSRLFRHWYFNSTITIWPLISCYKILLTKGFLILNHIWVNHYCRVHSSFCCMIFFLHHFPHFRCLSDTCNMVQGRTFVDKSIYEARRDSNPFLQQAQSTTIWKTAIWKVNLHIQHEWNISCKEPDPGPNSVVSQIWKNIKLACASIILRACRIETIRLTLEIKTLSKQLSSPHS